MVEKRTNVGSLENLVSFILLRSWTHYSVEVDEDPVALYLEYYN
jgi:hypothetical protein